MQEMVVHFGRNLPILNHDLRCKGFVFATPANIDSG